MKTLFLLRHADADETVAGATDTDRVLSDRGIREAATLPERFARFPATPTLALCSPARRAIQTLEGWLAERPDSDLAVETDEGLYLASGTKLAECLLEVRNDVESLLIVAHNPGIGIFAHEFLRPEDHGPAAEGIRRGFPPAALAVFEFDVNEWTGVSPGRGRLVGGDFPR